LRRDRAALRCEGAASESAAGLKSGSGARLAALPRYVPHAMACAADRARRHGPQGTRGHLMMRAILAGGGVGLLGVFAGFLYFLSLAPSPSPSQLTIGQAGTVGIFALFGGIGSLFFSRRFPASSWIATIVGWILGFFAAPMLIEVAILP